MTARWRGGSARPRLAGAFGGLIAGAAIVALSAAGCARASLVLPVRIEPETLTAPSPPGRVTGYESAARVIAAVMASELALPLPPQFALFVYPSRGEYEQGLVRERLMSPERATQIAEQSVALGRHRQLFINDEAFRGAPRRAWLGIVAHELTHLAQYELSRGRRGRSEQWLREGMAEWVASRVLERLGEGTYHHRRGQALRAVARALPALEDPLDLVVLGSPRGWAARSVHSGGGFTYGLAFLLADGLIRRHGFESLIAYFRAFVDSDDRFGHFRRAFGCSLGEFRSEALEQLRTDLERWQREAADAPVSMPDAGREARVLEGRDEEDIADRD